MVCLVNRREKRTKICWQNMVVKLKHECFIADFKQVNIVSQDSKI